MAQIQWYPGHMHKAAREMRQALSAVDMFIELLDARLPYSSANPMLAELRAEKPCIRLLTRSDLAESRRTDEWLRWFEGKGQQVFAISSGDRQQVRGITAKCRNLFAERVQPIVVMVVGIPNVGKSTLINILADRVIARTGNEPAVTQRQQRIQLDHDVVLMDTPGVLWPNVENPASGYRLAASGAIRQTAHSFEDVAWHLAEFLLRDYAELIAKRYGYQVTENDPVPLFEHIGRKRGCLKPGGNIDQERVARILLGDFRDGTIGRITLETPQMMVEELVEVEQVREQKAARKAERKKRWKQKR